jgi:hypothetical protein
MIIPSMTAQGITITSLSRLRSMQVRGPTIHEPQHTAMNDSRLQRSIANRRMRTAAVLFLVWQGMGGLAWWAMLLAWPESRAWFRASDAPNVTLLAFFIADVVLYCGGSLLAAYGLMHARPWAFPVLCVHSGAAMYAALYCLTLWMFDSHMCLGAVMMAPSLIVPPLIAWYFRPREVPPC